MDLEGATGGDALARHIAHALQCERMAQALAHADSDIASRIDTGEVPGFVERFLEKQWRQVLARSYDQTSADIEHEICVTSGNDVEAQVQAVVAPLLRAMDDLIWTTQPKFLAEHCQQVLARLGSLLPVLGRELDLINWQGPAREEFFARLAERHVSVARGPVSDRRRIEMAVDAAQKSSERRWEHESQAQARASDPARAAVNKITIATWVEILNDDETALHYYKLAWISPAHTMLIFIERDGQAFFSITTEKLIQYLQDHRARIMPESAGPR
ncbi:MAG: hypothetical protein RL748_1958 [Pseudomonadota bacterium]|jgi:hypothetical protein